MKHIPKYYNRFLNGDKIPRKYKKLFLGKCLSKTQIKLALRKLHIIKKIETIYDGYGIDGEVFCLKCGCKEIKSTGNMSSYPELYERDYCARCGHMVAEADNSPYYHEIYEVLSENNYTE